MTMTASIYVRKRNQMCYLQIAISNGTNDNNKRNRVILSTGIKVRATFWDSNLMKVRGHRFSKNLNNELHKRLTFIQNFIYNNIGSEDFSVNDVITEYDSFFVRLKDKSPTEIKISNNKFLDHVRIYLDEITASGKFKIVSLKSKRKSYNVIKECFEKMKINPSLDEIGLKHWDIFESYCINVCKVENITINNHRKEINVWMNHFNKYGLTSNIFHKSIPKLNAPDKVYPILELFEVEKVKHLTIKDASLSYFRFLMLFQIETGLRVSDLISIKKENFNSKDKLLILTTKKNLSNISIPLPDYIFEQLLELNFNMKKTTPLNYNQSIKHICELAGIDSPIETIKYIGSTQIREYKKKYTLIGSHSLRRTMITNNLKKGMSVELLMRIVGTRDRAVFQKYIQFSNEDAINELRRIHNYKN